MIVGYVACWGEVSTIYLINSEGSNYIYICHIETEVKALEQ